MENGPIHHLDRFVRPKEARVILGNISEPTRCRWALAGILVPFQIAPGVKAYKASQLAAFLESRPVAQPDRARVAKALASPRHGRAGRRSKAEAA